MRYIVLIFVGRLPHNYREIAVKNCQKFKKSAEKFVRTTSCATYKGCGKILRFSTEITFYLGNSTR